MLHSRSTGGIQRQYEEQLDPCVEELLLHDATTDNTNTTTTVSSLDVQVDDVVYDIGDVMLFPTNPPGGATLEDLEFILGT